MLIFELYGVLDLGLWLLTGHWANMAITLISPSCWCVREAVTEQMSVSEGLLTLLLGSLSPAHYRVCVHDYSPTNKQCYNISEVSPCNTKTHTTCQ